LEPGQRLPTERDLAATLEVSQDHGARGGAYSGYRQAAGYVTTGRRGRGGSTFIQTGAVRVPTDDQAHAGPGWMS
jgi:DNA-binding transcriptional regulator YhcF (GntR family)